jgi:signal transduction histidine kinase
MSADALVDRDDGPELARSRLVAAGLVAAVAVVGVVILLGTPPPAYRDPDVGAVVLVLASAATMWWWRTAPLASLFGAAAVVIVNAAAGYQVGVVQYPVYIALYAVFAWAPRRQRWWAVVASVVGVAGYAVADRGESSAAIVVGVAVTCLVAMLLGDATRSRRELAASQRVALELHDREREAAMERLVLEERARLARELHDSLGHAINVMVMQAGVGRHVFDERPQFAREALEHVETVGRVALGELDAVLRVLRPVDRDAVGEPASFTLSGLDALCDRIRATGREVELHVEPVELGPSTERAAYRIVQEALTNAARHTQAGRISVSVSTANGSVVLTVLNPVPRPVTPVAGRGLVNMRERAVLEGGQLEYGPVAGGFQVRATLPAGEVRPS